MYSFRIAPRTFLGVRSRRPPPSRIPSFTAFGVVNEARCISTVNQSRLAKPTQSTFSLSDVFQRNSSTTSSRSSPQHSHGDTKYRRALRLECNEALKTYPELRDRETCKRARVDSYEAVIKHAREFGFTSSSTPPAKYMENYLRTQHRGEMAEALLDDSGDPIKLQSRLKAKWEVQKQLVEISSYRQVPHNLESGSKTHPYYKPQQDEPKVRESILADECRDALKRHPEFKDLKACHDFKEDAFNDIWHLFKRPVTGRAGFLAEIKEGFGIVLKVLDADAILQSSGKSDWTLKDRQDIRKKLSMCLKHLDGLTPNEVGFRLIWDLVKIWIFK